MFLPIGDSPNIPKTPWITWSLIAVNVAVHLALWPLSYLPADPDNPVVREYLQTLYEERGVLPRAVSQGDLVRFEYGIKPGAFSLGDALTSMFLHGGLLHLAGNMLFLWIFGDNVEHRIGRRWFLLVYLATGLAAAGGDTILRWGSSIPSVGASGAISGVLGLYFAWFPRNRVRVFLFLFPFLMNVVELPARIVLGIYLVIDNLLPLLLTGGAGGVSHGAHIGGFIAGWVIAQSWQSGGRGRRERPPSAFSQEGPFSPERLALHFQEALDAGRVAEAASLLFDLPRSRTRLALSADDKSELGEALALAGEPRTALAAFQRALADHPRGPGRARAHLGAARLLLHAFGSPTAAYQHLYSAMEESPSAAERETARALLAELEGSARSLPRRRW
jgi:membrane associated rhomboid family serine protease